MNISNQNIIINMLGNQYTYYKSRNYDIFMIIFLFYENYEKIISSNQFVNWN